MAEIVVSCIREGIMKVMMTTFNCNECNSAEKGNPLPFVGFLGSLNNIRRCNA